MTECWQKKYHCANCPIRRLGMEKPHSLFARMHRWHSSWNKGWKAYLAELKLRKGHALGLSQD